MLSLHWAGFDGVSFLSFLFFLILFLHILLLHYCASQREVSLYLSPSLSPQFPPLIVLLSVVPVCLHHLKNILVFVEVLHRSLMFQCFQSSREEQSIPKLQNMNMFLIEENSRLANTFIGLLKCYKLAEHLSSFRILCQSNTI